LKPGKTEEWGQENALRDDLVGYFSVLILLSKSVLMVEAGIDRRMGTRE